MNTQNFQLLKKTERKEATATSKTSGGYRIPELDGLRGIAILLVVSFHYINNQIAGSTNKMASILAKATGFGWLGVDLFFILSGFLIGGILISNKQSKKYFGTFYIRRLVRIVPNYFLLLACYGIIWYFGIAAGNHFLTGNNDIPYWSYFLMLHNFFMAGVPSMGNDSLSITWSIGVEEQFYLVFPLLVYFIRDKWLPALLVCLIVSASIVRAQFDHWIPRYVLLPARFDGLAMGFLVAWLHKHGYLMKYRKKLRNLLPWLMVVVILTCGYFYWKYDDLGVVKHTLFAIIFSSGLILALIAANSWYGAVLRNSILMWIGTISYSLYLFHELILGLTHHFITHNENHIDSLADVGITFLAFFLSLLCAWGVFKWLEQPMVLLGKRFKY